MLHVERSCHNSQREGKGAGVGDKSRDLAESASFLSEFLRILSIGFCCHHIR